MVNLNSDMKTIILGTVLFLSLFISGCSNSETAADPPAPAGYGSVKGTVISNNTGQPVVNATVLVSNKAAITGEDGSFILEGIPVGGQSVRVTKSGYAPLRDKLIVVKDMTANFVANISTAHLMNYDVVILGAGTGGVSAAIQAARLGVRVALVEQTDWVGGQMTAAAVSTLDEGPYVLSHRNGIYREFYNRIKSYYSASGKSTGTAYFSAGSTAFEPSVGRDVLFGMIHDADSAAQSGGVGAIDVYLRTKFSSASVNGDVVQGVVLEDGTKFNAGIVIDATEYGDFIPMTPARYRAGNSTSDDINLNANLNPITYTAVIRKHFEPTGNVLIMTTSPAGYEQTVAILKTWVTNDGTGGDKWYTDYVMDYSKPRSFVFQNAYRGLPDRNNPDYYDASRDSYMKITKTGINNFVNDYPATVRYLEDISFRRQVNCAAMLKTLQVLYYFQNELGQVDWSVAEDEGFLKSYSADEIICSSFPTEINQLLKHFPVIPYVRESRRVIGMVTLTADDIRRDGYRAYKRFPTVVAVGDYPIDLHGADSQADLDCGDDVSAIRDPFNVSGGAFQIPFEVFVPEKVDGLLAAEKNLSVSRLVEGAIREQPVTMMTGQAAGAIAAIAVKKRVQPRSLDPAHVQQELIKNGCILSIDN